MGSKVVWPFSNSNSGNWALTYRGSPHAEPCRTQLDTAANNLIRPSTQPNSWPPVQMAQASSLVDQWAYIGSYTRSWVATYCARGFGGGKRSQGWFFPLPAKRFEPPTSCDCSPVVTQISVLPLDHWLLQIERSFVCSISYHVLSSCLRFQSSSLLQVIIWSCAAFPEKIFCLHLQISEMQISLAFVYNAWEWILQISLTEIW